MLTHPSFLSPLIHLCNYFGTWYVFGCDGYQPVAVMGASKGCFKTCDGYVLYIVSIESVTSVVGKIQRWCAFNTTIYYFHCPFYPLSESIHP